MPILDIDGRPRSVRTEDERLENIRTMLESFTSEERAALDALIDDDEDDLHAQLIKAEYEREPVSPHQFLTDEYYIGAVGNNMWPQLQVDFDELFDGGYSECILSGSLGWGKCLESLSFFVDGEYGRRIEIGQAVGTTPLVPSLDVEISHQRSSRVWKSGQKACAKLVLASGQWLEASLDHPVLTPSGYCAIGDLGYMDFVAVARRVPDPEKPLVISDNAVVVTAALIADGGMTVGSTIYTKGDKVLRDEVVMRSESLPGFNGCGRVKGKPSINLKGLQEWTGGLGIRCLSKVKRVPAEYFGLNDDQLALFLRWLFTDGNVYCGSPRKIEITLASEGLIDDIQYLLRRFGIVARKSYRVKKNQTGVFDAWRLQIVDASTQITFMERIGVIPGKEAACLRLLRQARSVRSNTNWDVVPITNAELKDIRRETGPHNNKTWNKIAGQADGTCMGVQRFKRLCEVTGYNGRYRRFADMVDDVVWERVESVEDTGVHDVYDLSVPETGNAVVNGIIVHNSYFASCALLYVIYQMTCMRNPQEVYGLAKGSSLAIAMLSATREAARRVPLAELGNKLQLSPYFKEKVPFKIASTMYEIRFPSKRLLVVAGASSSAAIGTNVFAAFLDEMAFFGGKKMFDRAGRQIEVDKSEIITSAITRRMKSRFLKAGKLPGIVFMVSSKERPVAYIEQRISEAREQNDSTVFIREYSTWDVKPPEDFSGKTFKISVGSDRVRAKLDPTELDEDFYAEQGIRTIAVPTDYRKDFERDLEGSIRDIAGIATETVSPFIHRVEKIQEAVVEGLPSAVAIDEWCPNVPLELIWERVAQPFIRRLPGGLEEDAWRPLRHPDAPRYVHIDTALTGDSASIVIAHPAGWTEVIRRDHNGDEYTEIAPVIESDLLLRVIPPPGDEIVLGELRFVVYQFAEHGFSVVFASCDSYQSADTLQQFRARGIDAEVQSMDKTMIPYDLTKTALYEGRVRLQENYWCVRELQQLMRVPKLRAKGFKIDHPRIGPDGKPGTKDVADGLTGVVYSITQRATGRPIPMVTTATARAVDEDADHSWVTEGRIMVQTSGTQQRKTEALKPRVGKMPLPFVRG